MPETILLTERLPLVFKAAKWVAGSSAERPLDLSHCAIVVPTAGAGRRLRSELVRLAGESRRGLLAPLVTTPMGLLSQAGSEGVATRLDALLGWADVISTITAENFPLLLAGFSNHRRSAFRIGESLLELCAFLAQAGLTPLSPEIVRALPSQEDRWRELRSLYERYLERMTAEGLEDSNVARIKTAKTALEPQNIRRVIVAGVPDLSQISQEYLQNLESLGVTVAVLVDAPDCQGVRFDAWGRPDPESWSRRDLPLRLEDFVVTADPWSEAEVVARMIAQTAVGLCVVDAELLPFHERAMRKRTISPYNPAGRPLALFECATLSKLWLSFSPNGRIAELRALAEHPAFLRLLGRDPHLRPTAVLSSLDELESKILVETVDDAAAYIEQAPSSKPSVAALVTAAQGLRAKFGDSLDDLPAFLRAVYFQTRIAQSSSEAEALSALSSLLKTVRDSPLSRSKIKGTIFCEEMKNVAIFGSRGEADIELNGWLEASWLPDTALVVSGCTEGALPERIIAHPFLPDSARIALGLHHRVQRFARDAYLLHCLLSTRRPGAVKLTLSRVRPDGEPAKPSRMLFRCSEGELSFRVRKVFGSVASQRTSHARERTWSLEISQRPPPTSLRVTAFGDYLKCPLRFYLKHVLDIRKFDAPKFEMDPLDFGSVFHKTLEQFALHESVRDSSDPKEIEAFVLSELDVVLTARLGRRLSLPLRVQREGLRVRLREFARIQALERKAGWRILHGELAFTEDNTLKLSGLPIVGTLDRVDVHEETDRRRILDYKTFARRKSAISTHLDFGAAKTHEWTIVFNGKGARWSELQLPLYRALAEFHWPDEPSPPLVGYFLLPERTEESGIDEFILEEHVFASAMECAETVASRIARGIFWPPGTVEFDDFAGIFLGEDPASIISEKSREFLMGEILQEMR